MVAGTPKRFLTYRNHDLGHQKISSLLAHCEHDQVMGPIVHCSNVARTLTQDVRLFSWAFTEGNYQRDLHTCCQLGEGMCCEVVEWDYRCPIDPSPQEHCPSTYYPGNCSHPQDAYMFCCY